MKASPATQSPPQTDKQIAEQRLASLLEKRRQSPSSEIDEKIADLVTALSH